MQREEEQGAGGVVYGGRREAMDRLQKPPSYMVGLAEQRVLETAAAGHLVDRGTKRVEGGLVFTRDRSTLNFFSYSCCPCITCLFQEMDSPFPRPSELGGPACSGGGGHLPPPCRGGQGWTKGCFLVHNAQSVQVEGKHIFNLGSLL